MHEIPVNERTFPIAAIVLLLTLLIIILSYMRERNTLAQNNISVIITELEQQHGDIKIKKFRTTSTSRSTRTDKVMYTVNGNDTVYHAIVETDRVTNKFTIIFDDGPAAPKTEYEEEKG